MKSFITVIIAVAILTAGAICENFFINRQFTELSGEFQVLYEKTDKKTATERDVLSVQDLWLEKKKALHIFIPHNEIKEIDLWLSEMVTLVRDRQWEDAMSKIEVLCELAEQIPKTFDIRAENIL